MTKTTHRRRRKKYAKSNKQGLRNAREVRHKILHDGTYDPDDILIGFDDQVHGPLEMPVSESMDTPVNRISYFRRKGDPSAIMWDKKGLYDAIFGSGEVATVSMDTAEMVQKAIVNSVQLKCKQEEDREHKQQNKTLPKSEETEDTRSRDETLSFGTVSDDDLDLPSNDAKLDFSKISKLRLEAIFHPKFENEKQTDQEIREQMKRNVELGAGYLEVSLKHSGSLLLWSGGQRYYSKNSTDNVYTSVGEILLRQHFVRAWWNAGFEGDFERRYRECSEYVVQKRLTLSFEVVTAVLGDHGDRPRRDFLILTAIADRNRASFWSTSELVEFAQRHRLPHNDVWAFSTTESVDALFCLYDEKREIGFADDVTHDLDKAANASVVSMYPHVSFQGNILEGIVIRYIPTSTQDITSGKFGQLATDARALNELIPPNQPNCYELVADRKEETFGLFRVNIRTLYNETRSSGGQKVFLTKLRSILSEIDKDRRTVSRFSRSKRIDVPTLTKALTVCSDLETRRIACLLRSLKNLKSRVEYSICREETRSGDRYLCILHVLQDATFQKFRRNKKHEDLELFRGFSFEFGIDDDAESLDHNEFDNNDADTQALVPDAQQGEFLMLKMKFLPYMVRTFGCRNGLPIIMKDGPSAFEKYTNNLLKKWGISSTSQRRWKPFFHAWALYAAKRVDKKLKDESHLPQLCGNAYLEHLENFTKQYEIERSSKPEDEIDVSTEEAMPSDAGLLVFVPGIPGCGKSTYFSKVTESELTEHLPTDRKVLVRVGDLTKGKFWSVVRKELKKIPKCVYIADKNVPDRRAWQCVAEMCEATGTIAVPLMHDVLETTQVPGMRKLDGSLVETRPTYYPFPLTYLAVCIARVLARPALSHPGKLDRSCTRAALVVVKFFTLYRWISAEDITTTLENAFDTAGSTMLNPIFVPFFRDEKCCIPADLEEILIEAIQAQAGFDKENVDMQSSKNEYASDLDRRLVACIEKHTKKLFEMTVEAESSRSSAVKQIMDRVHHLTSTSVVDAISTEVIAWPVIYLAAVDVKVKDVHALLRRLKNDAKFHNLFSLILEKGSSVDKVLMGDKCPDKRFILKTHVTLAHSSNCNQRKIYETFGDVKGCSVTVLPVAICWSDRIVALEVQIGEETFDGRPMPPSTNKFVHITLWRREKSKSKEANQLPDEIEKGKGTRVQLVGCTHLRGVVSLLNK